MKDKPRVSIITLGCAKNLVDSEFLAKQLNVNGYNVHHELVTTTETVIINTCGFINDAKEESVETILNYAEAKNQGTIHNLYVMGCLSERFKNQLEEEIKEVDGFFGVDEQKNLLKQLHLTYSQKYDKDRQLATPQHYSYLKIAEGCNRKCSFCSIPLIRGRYKSEPIEKLYAESLLLSKQGVKEINLIAQDLSYYGYDIYGKQVLPELLTKLATIDNFHWIRLLYLYPDSFPFDVLEIMKENKNICNYLDIPLQHINDKLLKNMRRGINRKDIYELIEHIRLKIPDITLRTTMMVGYPGETERKFEELKSFVQEIEFDRLGVFAYSEEEGTYSEKNFKDSIPASVKQERADELMQIQQEISLKHNQSKIGKFFEVIVDREDKEYYYSRSFADAPDVDNEILIPKKDKNLSQGNFYTVKINDAYYYDLIGVAI